MAESPSPSNLDNQLTAQLTFSPAQRVYVTLAALSVAALLIADIIGVKLFQLDVSYWSGKKWTIVHTCGMLPFPITFLITDLVNEYYGRKAARRIVWLSLAMGLLVYVVVRVSLRMPHLDAPFNVDKDAFAQIFATSQVMYIASLIAYLVGNMCDIAMFGWIKRLTGGRMIWLRATGSTVVSQFIDSFIVTWVAFSVGRRYFGDPGGPSPMPFDEVLRTAATGYVLKFVIGIGITPLIYLGRHIIRTRYGLVPLPASNA